MKKQVLCLAFLFSFCVVGFAQNDEESLEEAFETFAELTREKVHVHLNKTVFIKGEMMGFTAYVIDNDTKLLSENSTNLYCIILNGNNSIVDQKLVRIEKGIAQGDFLIDSMFKSGEYKFKAYTNWSRNFGEENNHFLEKFMVLDPENESVYKPSQVSDSLNVRIIPESGRLLMNLENNVGILIKDHLGLGVANLDVSILDEDGQIITSLTLNEFGIGKFLLKPISKKNMEVVFSYNEKQHKFSIPEPEDNGLGMTLQEVKNDVVMTLQTNSDTQVDTRDENFKLVIHNGIELKQILVSLDGENARVFKFAYDDLYSGMNVFTLFDKDNKPLCERLFFNNKGVKMYTDLEASTTKVGDSLLIKIPFSGVDLSVAHNLSISILPSETKSYVHHQNIVSSVFVKPFIKDPLENVRTYLTHITDKKRYQLNLLLLSQGQSRYNWNRIFNNPPDYIYDFEMGINYTVNLNSAKTEGIFIYPNVDTKSELVTIGEGQKVFSKLGMFPYENEKIRMGELNKNGELGKAQLFLQFTPSKIPEFKNSYEGVTVQSSFQSANTDFTSLEFKGIDNYEKLDEVKVEAKKAYTRLEKLRNVTLGKVEEFDDDMRRQYKTFAQYIHTRGFYVEETLDIERQTGELTIFRIYNRKTTSFANNIPLIYLDNALLNNLDILHRFKMDIVDYIEVNSAGIGEGIRGGAGVIKIFTDPKKVFRVEPKDSYTEYEIPLKFSRPKPFFVPNYPSFSSGFFKEFGVIDWIPNAQIDKGYVSFKIVDTGMPINLYIEGVVNGDTFVSDDLTINKE